MEFNSIKALIRASGSVSHVASQDNLCPWAAPLGAHEKCLAQRFPGSDLIRGR